MGKTIITIPEELHKKLRHYKVETKQTMSGTILKALEFYLDFKHPDYRVQETKTQDIRKELNKYGEVKDDE